MGRNRTAEIAKNSHSFLLLVMSGVWLCTKSLVGLSNWDGNFQRVIAESL